MQILLQEFEEGEREFNSLFSDSVNGNLFKFLEDGQIFFIKEETFFNIFNKEIILENIQ